uniref:RING-type domain-containing protein n=1 Tax=Leersia perrieri TaxID=77586 RepID=A0A0D9VM34_9ORYZ
MPRATRPSKPLPATAPASAAGEENVRSDASLSEPSCSTPAHHQAFRPVTRSMTRKPTAITASPDVKEGGSASASKRTSSRDTCFSTQLAASRPSVTRIRTPHNHNVASSAWKPLTQPIAMTEVQKRTSVSSTDPSAKRSRVALSQAAKDSPTVHRGKKSRDEESTSQGDQLDGAAIPSPSKKLQMCKRPSGVLPKRKSTVANQDGKLAAPLPMVKLETESGESSVIASSKIGPATTNNICQSAEAVQVLPPQLQLDTKNNSNSIITEAIANGTKRINLSVGPVTTESIANRTSQVNQSVFPVTTDTKAIEISQVNQSAVPVTTEAILNRTHQVNQSFGLINNKAIVNRTSQVNKSVAPVNTEAIINRAHQVVAQNKLAAPVIAVPGQNSQEDLQRKLAKLLAARRQISGPSGATGTMVAPKLEIGKAKGSSNVLSDPAFANAKALLIKQQEQLLQQYKSAANSQQQVHIKGPALTDRDEVPPVEPLGTRCQLCKLDIAFRPQGEKNAGDNAPPVVAVLACHHAFHSFCIESIYGLAEPSQCIACLDSVKA